MKAYHEMTEQELEEYRKNPLPGYSLYPPTASERSASEHVEAMTDDEFLDYFDESQHEARDE